jgi:small conductance mechanosensitive channel
MASPLPTTTNLLAIAPLTDIGDWVRSRGLEIVLVILGSILLARFAEWLGARVTARIDSRASGDDALVRSEAAKHRHSLTQVLTWAAVVLIYTIAVFLILDLAGIPVTGLVAPATVLGVGLGFGAQRIVGDVLAGFFLITERQYGFGDVVSIQLTSGGDPAAGTVEDVTLRITRMRSSNGEVVIVPNGQIVKVTNLSRDWARAVVDIPVPTTVDVNRVNEILREVGRQAFRDAALRKLLLDEPSVMGVESLGLDQVNVRMVARTLPGKQFEVGRDLRARIVLAFRREGLTLPSSPADTAVLDGNGVGLGDGGRHASDAPQPAEEGGR